MALVIQKFGGSSVGDLERIENVAEIVASEANKDNDLIVVLSAMSGETDNLIDKARHFSDLVSENERENHDFLVSSGEMVSCGLLALALAKKGLKARSFAGWQVPIKTDNMHSQASILDIPTENIKRELRNGNICIVTGFQGVSPEGKITTLGRGGSDTSAIALAIALHADKCNVYTDVDGVYTSDPKLVKNARNLRKISYEEMLEMASLGAKVMHPRSISLAKQYNLRVNILSSFTRSKGTEITENEEVMERRRVTGVIPDNNAARVTLRGVKNEPGVAATLFTLLGESAVNVDMIVQNVNDAGDETDITFTVGKSDVERCDALIQGCKTNGKVLYKSLNFDKNVVKISVIGVGMISNSGIAGEMFSVLAKHGINILVISTSEIKISILIDDKYLELAVKSLHDAFELEKQSKKGEAK